MKLGFFGGCFNPITNTHIQLAKNILKKMNVDKVIFVPVGDYYKKTSLICGKDRYNMIKLAIQNEKNIEVEDIGVNSKVSLYTIDMFKLINSKYNNDDIYYIMGSDNFIKMEKWKSYSELINNYQYIILDRGNELYNISLNNITYLTSINKEKTDSTLIRKMINENKDVSEYINRDVYEYIIQNRLYKEG